MISRYDLSNFIEAVKKKNNLFLKFEKDKVRWEDDDSPLSIVQ